MSNVPSILIVDSNEGFAMMLQGGLEQDGEYQATVTTSGDEARQAVSADRFDLAIVDLGVDDPDGPTVARSLRQQQADLRLMLIPLGDELPPELSDLDVQGILPKPFFLPDLPEHINDALAKSVTTVASGSAEPTEPEPVVHDQPLVSSADLPDVLREQAQEITQAMERLSREINADVVILTSGESVIAHASRLSTEEIDALAQAVAESWRTSASVAQILGEKQRRFEQSVEGNDHMFYSLTIVEDIILSAALRGHVTLGMIRHQIKSTANALRKLVSTA
jgi:CheY-like chemotaxis protein